MPTDVANVKKKVYAARKANDYLPKRKKAKEPERLFDEFWREGEVGLLFGAAGTGKSLIAVQVADALARGTPLSGFAMPRRRRRVLYVDLCLTKPQFSERYGRYNFSENLFREKPEADKDLFEWIKEMVAADDIGAVIIDDLSAEKRTYDGIRETLVLMRRLKRLCEKTGISVLAIADAAQPTDGWARESDLGRSIILCKVADSVFSIGRMLGREATSRLMQTRSRGPKLFWNTYNAPLGKIKRLPNGLTGFEFDERFAPEMDEAKRELIRSVYWLHEAGETFRSIAGELGIAISTAHRLSRMWTPAMGGKPVMAVDPEPEEEEEEIVDGGLADIWLSEVYRPEKS